MGKKTPKQSPKKVSTKKGKSAAGSLSPPITKKRVSEGRSATAPTVDAVIEKVEELQIETEPLEDKNTTKGNKKSVKVRKFDYDIEMAELLDMMLSP